MTITIRALKPDDWALYRQLRLHALAQEPQVFSSNLAKESAFTEDTWRGRLADTGSCIFGLFDGDAPIGITGIVTVKDENGNPERSAVLVMSHIDKNYRGRGLSRLLYEARIAWAIDQPQFDRIIVSHRASNEASRRANQSFGFTFDYAEMHTWPDGESEEQWFYTLPLSDLRP